MPYLIRRAEENASVAGQTRSLIRDDESRTQPKKGISFLVIQVNLNS
jgi:hypothetical protein